MQGGIELTYPERAWLVFGFPVFVALAFICIVALFFRHLLLRTIQNMVASQTQIRQPIDPSLRWVAPVAEPAQLTMLSILCVILVLALVSQFAPLLIGIIVAPLATLLIMWVVLKVLYRRYTSQIDRELPTAVSRLSSLLAGGNGFQPALNIVLADMKPNPLRTEWQFLLNKLGTPLATGGRLATPAQVAGALASQTPSARHATFLYHLEVALDQTQDVLVKRTQAAAQALFAAERRRSAAATALSQMRYSGVAIGLAGLLMAAYLGFTQRDRFIPAYQSPVGIAVGIIVLAALITPIIGGILLSQVEEIDY